MATDNCNGCGEDYQLTTKKDVLWVFLNEPQHNHIRAFHAECQNVTLIFLTPPQVCHLLQDGPFKIRVMVEAPAEIKKLHPVVTEVPQEWVDQLRADLKMFGGEG